MHQSDLPANPVLFRRRVLTQEARIGDVTFTIRSLTKLEALYIRTMTRLEDGSDDTYLVSIMLVACGLDAVTGLTDETGALVEVERHDQYVCGHKITPITQAWIESLDPAITNQLAEAITQLSNFGDTERTRLDFTSPS